MRITAFSPFAIQAVNVNWLRGSPWIDRPNIRSNTWQFKTYHIELPILLQKARMRVRVLAMKVEWYGSLKRFLPTPPILT
jgi:hypothetical protein